MARVFSELVYLDALVTFHAGASELAAFVVEEMVLVCFLVKHLSATVRACFSDVLALES